MFSGLAARLAMPAILLCIGFIVGMGVGYDWGVGEGARALSDLQRQHAEAQAKAERAARLELWEAQRVGDELSERVDAAESRRTVKTIEVIREIPKHTSGRECLSADAVRLLDDAITPAQLRHAVPEAAGAPAQTPAGIAASDTDVAQWIANAKRLYGACRDDFNALIDWHGADVGLRRGRLTQPTTD